MSVRCVLLAATALALPAGASAEGTAQPNDNRSAAEIVVTGVRQPFNATKSDTPILETARSISVETAADFRDKGFETLDDALAYTAGVTAEPFGFDMRGDFPAVRGLSVPEFRDNLQFLFGFYNNPRPELYTLEQVEVLKGPASVLYGAGSPGGIINVISKRPFAGSAGEVRARVGSFDRYELMTDLNGFIPGTRETGFARLVTVYRNTGTQIDEVDEEKIVISPSVTAQPAEGMTITLLGNYTRQDTDSGHQFYPVTGTLLPSVDGRRIDPVEYFGEPGFNRYDSESIAITLLLEQEIMTGLKFEAVSRFVDSTADYLQSWPAFLGVGVPRIDADGNATRSFYLADNRSEQFAVDARFRASFATGPFRHELLAGVQYQDVMTDSDTAFLNRGTINVFDPVYGNGPSEAEMRALKFNAPSNFITQTGYYISDQVTVGDLIVNAGVRFDDVRNRAGQARGQQDNATSFSAGALYRLPFGLAPYVSYAESFQPVVGLDRVTNAPLKPQRGRQYEAGIKWQVPDVPALITVAAFDIEQSNLPNPQAIAGAETQQEGTAKIRGIEVEAVASVGGFRIDANYALLDTEDPNGFRLSSIPRHQASLFGIYRFSSGPFDGFRIGAGVRHVGESESTGLRAGTGTPLTYVTDDYTVADLTAGYRFGRWDLSVNARNITGEDYFTTCLARGDCYPGERRSVIATLAYQL
jgi:iron complex outermembrane recepter protein